MPCFRVSAANAVGSATMPQTLISNSKSVTLPWWVSAIVLLAALLLTAGAIIALVHPAMLVSPGAAITPATRVYADYLFSRNLALAIALAALLLVRARTPLRSMIALAALIQLLDGIMDVVEARWAIVPGVLLLAAIFLAAALRLRRE